MAEDTGDVKTPEGEHWSTYPYEEAYTGLSGVSWRQNLVLIPIAFSEISNVTASSNPTENAAIPNGDKLGSKMEDGKEVQDADSRLKSFIARYCTGLTKYRRIPDRR